MLAVLRQAGFVAESLPEIPHKIQPGLFANLCDGGVLDKITDLSSKPFIESAVDIDLT